jgi:hypothetical protein
MKQYLALFRAGPGSLHASAVERLAEQNFDYALSWFGDEAPKMADGAVFVHRQKGPKWPGLEQTIVAHWDTIKQYRYLWLPDDDLLCVPELVSKMFAVCSDLQLELAQPALTPDSYFTHLITLQHSAFQVRFTNFVEIMAPILSLDLFSRIFHSLQGNISGYGLDALWPRFTQLGRVAIIDDTPVKHTRPVGGPNYAFSQKAGVPPAVEDWLTSARSFNDEPVDFPLNFGGLLQSGDAICIGGTHHEINAVLQALITSSSGLKLSALQLTHYLGHHFNYWADGGSRHARYPRSVLRVILNETLQHAGIRFPKPPQPESEQKAPAQSPTANLRETLS